MKNNRVKVIVSLLFSLNQLTHENFRSNGEFAQSPLQFMTLKFIKFKSSPTMKELASFLSITPPSATSLTNNLVKAGIIQRIFDKKDRRILRLIITEKGKNILKKGDKFILDYIGKNFEVLNYKEQDQLISIIEKLLKNVVKLK